MHLEASDPTFLDAFLPSNAGRRRLHRVAVPVRGRLLVGSRVARRGLLPAGRRVERRRASERGAGAEKEALAPDNQARRPEETDGRAWRSPACVHGAWGAPERAACRRAPRRRRSAFRSAARRSAPLFARPNGPR